MLWELYTNSLRTHAVSVSRSLSPSLSFAFSLSLSLSVSPIENIVRWMRPANTRISGFTEMGLRERS